MATDPVPFDPTWQVRIEDVPWKDMFVDRYQRPYDATMMREAAEIAERFNPDLFQPVELSDREGQHEPRYAIVDGQKRWTSFSLMGWQDQRMPARIHIGLSYEDESWLFQHFQTDRRPLSRFDLYRSRLEQGDVMARDIQRVLSHHDLAVGREVNNRQVGCINPLYRIWARNGRRGLLRVVDVICTAWGPFPQHFYSDLVMGLGAFLNSYGAVITDRRLAQVLGDTEPYALLVEARIHRNQLGGAVWLNVSEVIRQHYSKGLREESRLPRKSFAQIATEFRVGGPDHVADHDGEGE